MASSKLPQCVLITRFSALGDVALTVPVIYDVCRAYPGTRFVMTTRPFMAGMMINTPPNLTVVSVVLDDYKGLWGMLRLARHLRRNYGIDVMADLHSVMRTWVIGASMRVRGIAVKRLDKGRTEKRALIAGKNRRQLTATHERYRQVFAALGFVTKPQFTSIFDDTAPHCNIAPDKPDGHQWIALAPFAHFPGKEYPQEMMRQVLDQLAARPRTHIYLMGGGDKEKRVLAPWGEAYANVTSVAHIEHTFADELALLAQCDVMVSMDSANMHLASLVGLPVVSVWGATHPMCGFMGYRQSTDLAVQLEMDCRPCSVFGANPCRFGDFRCLTGISPQMIVDRIERVLQSVLD